MSAFDVYFVAKFRYISIFVDIFLPKSKPILLGILYRPSDKSDFVKHSNVFAETGVLDEQECYLLGDLNIDLILDERDFFSYKSYGRNGQNLPHLTKGYLDFCFSFSLEQLLSISTRVTSKTATLIDHVLIKSSQKVSQCGVFELGISDHDLVQCIRKTPSLKPNKYNDISIWSMKNYTKEKFSELLRKTDFPDYTDFTCLNKAYQDFIFKFSEVIDLLCPSKKLRFKANSKPWIDSETISAIRRREKLFIQKIQKIWFRNRQRSFPIGKNGSSES